MTLEQYSNFLRLKYAFEINQGKKEQTVSSDNSQIDTYQLSKLRMANDLINLGMIGSCNEYSILWQILSEDNPKI